MVSAQNKVAIVTGAGGGIGRAIAMKLARGETSLMLVDRVPAGIEALARELAALGGQASTCCADVGDEAGVSEFVERTMGEYGRIDMLVNNAGVSPKKPDGTKARLIEIPLDEWNEVMRVNLTSVFLACKATIPHMLAQGAGSIVSISSSAALDGGLLAASHYSASKGAISALTRTLSKELASQGIRVNAVAPGRVATPMATLSSDERNRAARERIPMGRFAHSDEVANSVAFLLSDEASYITGITLNVSGGYVVA